MYIIQEFLLNCQPGFGVCFLACIEGRLKRLNSNIEGCLNSNGEWLKQQLHLVRFYYDRTLEIDIRKSRKIRIFHVFLTLRD